MKKASSVAQDVHKASIANAKGVGKGADSAPRTEGGNVVFFSSDQKFLEDLKRLEKSNLKAKELREGIREIIDRYDVPELPKKYEEYEKYSGFNPEGAKENIIEFLRRVWAQWIKEGILTRPEFRKLDEKGEMAYRNWMRKNAVPEDVRLIRKSDIVDARARMDIRLVRQAQNITSAYYRRYG